jgi:small basic protein
MMPFYILAIYFGSYYGIIGVAIGVTFIRTFFGLVSFIILANILQTYVSIILMQMKNSFFAAMITAIIIKITKQLFINIFDFNQISSFTILFSLGIILYLFLIKVFFKESYNEIHKIFKKILIKKIEL